MAETQQFTTKNVQKPGSTGLRSLVTLACIVIIAAGLKLGYNLFMPIVVAFFLTVLSMPLTIWLKRLGLPSFLAIFLTIIINIIIIILVIMLGYSLISEFQEIAPSYIDKIYKFTKAISLKIDNQGLLKLIGSDLSVREFFFNFFQPDDVIKFITNSAIFGKLFSFIKTIVVILFLMCFMIIEGSDFGRKLVKINKLDGPNLRGLATASKDIQRYLVIKILVSFLTGASAFTLMKIFKQDLALLWGVTAFVLNFIPAVGSLLAAIPPVAIAFLNGLPEIPTSPDVSFLSILYSISYKDAIGLIFGYLLINLIFGNFLEPTLLGRRFGVSILVIILSLITWGWLWGIVGMFLAVPLTMLVKVMLENNRDLNWISIGLEKNWQRANLRKARLQNLKSKIATKSNKH